MPASRWKLCIRGLGKLIIGPNLALQIRNAVLRHNNGRCQNDKDNDNEDEHQKHKNSGYKITGMALFA